MTNDFAKLTLDERLEMIKKVAQGINVKNCLHLDIKPTNIFINEENGKWNGELVLADFGISANSLSLIYRTRNGRLRQSRPDCVRCP